MALFWFGDTVSISWAGLELDIVAEDGPLCLHLPDAGITGVCHQNHFFSGARAQT